jgi:dipeptidyl aminopeptidase/acylaminoacyl peptidase
MKMKMKKLTILMLCVMVHFSFDLMAQKKPTKTKPTKTQSVPPAATIPKSENASKPAALEFEPAAESPRAAAAKGAPVINRELFFDNPEIAGGQLSPDAKWMTYIKANKGTLNIWLKKADEPFENGRPITADTTRPVRSYFWSDDSKFVLYNQDKGGNENFHVYAVDPFATAEAATGVPPARDLTPLDNTRAYIYNVSQKNPTKMWVGLNNRDQAWHDLYELDIATGERKLLRENKDRITGWDFDWDENLRLATRTNDDGGNEILRVDEDKLTKIYESSTLEAANSISWTPDNKQFYLATNKGSERDKTELVLFDPLSMTETLVEKDPMGKVDFEDAVFSKLTRKLRYTSYTDAKERKYFKDPDSEIDYKFLQAKFEGKEISFNSSDKSEMLWLISVYSDTDPGKVYLFDKKAKTITFQYDPRPNLPREHLAPMESISYKSSDGLEIPAYVTYPKGKVRKNLPLLVVPHGGPWGRDYWGYNSGAQFWANRGYVVLRMNFRGSTGYGKKFLDAGNGEWGQKMQDDVTWGVKHLINQGIVDKNNVGITGGSYGGYVTLAGVTFTPDLYKVAVAVVAPSNLNTLLGSIPPYWESFKKTMYMRMADPTTEAGKKILEKQSPLNYVDKIKTPLMIVQGANDPRVKKAEADQIVFAMKEKNIPVEYILASDEGHGFARPVNNMAYLAASEKFMATHIGGRYQPTMKPDVEARLKEITVDISTMKKPVRPDMSIASKGVNMKPIKDLRTAHYDYKVEIEASGKKIPMTVARDVKEEGDKWVITDNSSSSMGKMSDISVVYKKTLKPSNRTTEQGPIKITLNYTEGMVKGDMTVQGKARNIETKIEDELIADGAGIDLVWGAMDLKENMTISYKVYDPKAQLVKTNVMKVIKKEKVKIAAGEFDSFVVETSDFENPNDKTTYWISDGRMVKSISIVPQMGNATVTSELIIRP